MHVRVRDIGALVAELMLDSEHARQFDDSSEILNGRTQNGLWIILILSTTTFVALPMVSGIGRANVVEDPPATPEFYDGSDSYSFRSGK